MNRRVRVRSARASLLVIALTLGFAGVFGTVVASAAPGVGQLPRALLPGVGGGLISGLNGLLTDLDSASSGADGKVGATVQLLTSDPTTTTIGTLNGSLSGSACPDAKGIVRGKGAVTYETTTAGVAAIRQQVVFNVEISVQESAFYNDVALSGQFFDGNHDLDGKLTTAKSKLSGDAINGEPDSFATVKTNPGFPVKKVQSNADIVGNKIQKLAVAVADKFQDAWRDGHTCVNVEVKSGDSRKVKPHEQIVIKAGARARDGAVIPKPLHAKLSSGKTKVDEGDENVPITTFKYEGPDPKGKGRVLLSSVSKRGIGRKELSYATTVDYKLAFDCPPAACIQDTHWDAIKCDGAAGVWDVMIASQGDRTARGTFTLATEPEPGGHVDTTTSQVVFLQILPSGDTGGETDITYPISFIAAPAGATGAKNHPTLTINGVSFAVKTGDYCK